MTPHRPAHNRTNTRTTRTSEGNLPVFACIEARSIGGYPHKYPAQTAHNRTQPHKNVFLAPHLTPHTIWVRLSEPTQFVRGHVPAQVPIVRG